MVRRMSSPGYQHAVAVVGGATAGAEAAGLLAERGVLVVVFEQNARPYGKIEDGLPRWHQKLRHKEYEAINERLARPGVLFVPKTKVGEDVGLDELAHDWGFTAVLLTHGAWRDRPFPIEGADAFVGKGLLYQNSFIQWFNHFEERGYDGPQYDVQDGAIVVGGGLASVDVMKVLQIQTVRAALAERGIDEEMLRLEQEGIPAVLEEYGFDWDSLGLRGATLVYRRRIEDMPLADIPPDADDARREKAESTRRRILEKAAQKYCFNVKPLRIPVGIIADGGRLAGLRLQRTRVEDGRALPVEGAIEEVRTPLVISSIGSVPEPMSGITQDGILYRWDDHQIGRVHGYQHVFGTGNVVTGKGNILTSRRHSQHVTARVIEEFLGLGNGRHQREDALAAHGDDSAEQVAAAIAERPTLSAKDVEGLLARVRARQEAVGYEGPYPEWIARAAPPGQA
jgi:NADPH-dependent glutamate synthase beta subunit-like oxidoreductase